MSDRDKILSDLSAYLDGELPPSQARRVEDALRQDPPLAAELESLRRTRDLVRGLPRAAAAPDFVSSVLAQAERLRLVSPSPDARERSFSWMRTLAAAAVVVVAVSVGVIVAVTLWNTPTSPPGSGVGQSIARHEEKALGEKDRGSGAIAKAATGDVRGVSYSGSPAVAKLDGVAGGAGNEVIYADETDLDSVVASVNSVLVANGAQPVMSRQNVRGAREVTVLAYVEPEQVQGIRSGLEQVRAQQTALQMPLEDDRYKRQRGYEYARAGGTAADSIAKSAGMPATAPAIRGVPCSRPEIANLQLPDAYNQWMPGACGNSVLNRANNYDINNDLRASQVGGGGLVQQPAAIEGTSAKGTFQQVRLDMKPMLITLRSRPVQAGATEGGRMAEPVAAGAPSGPATRAATSPVESRPATTRAAESNAAR